MVLPFMGDAVMEISVNQSSQYSTAVRYAGPIERIGLQFAMQAEAQPLIDALGLNSYSAVERLPHLSFACGRIGQIEVQVVVHGQDERYRVDRVGTENATLAAFKLIEFCQPSVLINAGTAGGFQIKGAGIGDVYLSSGVVFHDHRIPLGRYRDFGRGAYPVIDAPQIQRECLLKSGIVSTGNSLDLCPADLTQMQEMGASIKDMEAAAIGQVAYDQRVPFMAIKSVTDLVDHPCDVGEVFLQNLALASGNLADKVRQVITLLSRGYRLEEL